MEDELSDILEGLWASDTKPEPKKKPIVKKIAKKIAEKKEVPPSPAEPVKTMSYEEAIAQGLILSNIS